MKDLMLKQLNFRNFLIPLINVGSLLAMVVFVAGNYPPLPPDPIQPPIRELKSTKVVKTVVARGTSNPS